MYKLILKDEAGLTVQSKRFLFKNYSYPMQLVAFEHPTKLGYFDPNYYEIGINKELSNYPDEQILLVLRHEIAHYLTYLYYGPGIPDHGPEFRSICKQYGWDESSFATFNLDAKIISQKKSAASKITKLLNLSQSKNANEASLALSKAQDLLVKWGIQNPSEEKEFIARRILKSKRTTQKMRSIAHILRKFCVSPIINKGKEYTYLELFGAPTHVEIAEYIGIVLDRVIDELWKNESLSGSIAKNSFIQGLEEGFLESIKPEKSNTKALISLENVLQEALAMAYPKLSQSIHKTKRDKTAFASGQKKGSSLLIDPAITKPNNKKLLIKWK